jgi:nicotinate-nucleotide adenylyltransferase
MARADPMGEYKLIKRRIAIFGGAFDPPHIGHTAICRWVFGKGRFDELFIVPCFKHPFGKDMEGFDHRLAMCRLAFGKLLLPLRILDIEKSLPGPSLTHNTILRLIEKNPDAKFTLIVGHDVAKELSDWHHIDKIKELVDIIEVPRGEESAIPNVSSTDVRTAIKGKKPYRHIVEPEVAIYIVTNSLYH